MIVASTDTGETGTGETGQREDVTWIDSLAWLILGISFALVVLSIAADIRSNLWMRRVAELRGQMKKQEPDAHLYTSLWAIRFKSYLFLEWLQVQCQ